MFSKILDTDKGKSGNIFDPVMGNSFKNPKVNRLIEKALLVSKHNRPVFILGEIGCPAKQLAKGIHKNSEKFAKSETMLSLDCFYYQQQKRATILKSRVKQLTKIYLKNIYF